MLSLRLVGRACSALTAKAALLMAVGTLAWSSSTQAAVIASYNFDQSLALSSSDSNVTATAITTAGFTVGYNTTEVGHTAGSLQLLLSDIAPTGGTAGTVYNGDGTDYVEFTVTPNVGYTLNLSGAGAFVYEKNRLSSSSAALRLLWKVVYDDLSDGAGFQDFAGNAPATPAAPGFTSSSFTLPAALSNIGSSGVKFRILFSDGGSSSTATTGAHLLDNLVLNGTATFTDVPEPATLSVLSVGGFLLLRRRRA